MTQWVLFVLGLIVGWSAMIMLRAWIRRRKLKKHYDTWQSIRKEKHHDREHRAT